jgi:hypothetical protein
VKDKWSERLQKTLSSTLTLVRTGKTERAFGDLDALIEEVARDGHNLWVTTLCHHGAVLAHAAGDLHREIAYGKRALPFAASDRHYAVYNLAQLLLRDGQTDLARQYAIEAYEACKVENTEAGRDLATAILTHWPDLQ